MEPVIAWRLAKRGNAPAVEVAASGYWLPMADTNSYGLDVGIRLTRLEWRWGWGERNPTLGVGLHRDFGRFDGFRTEAAFDLGLGGQILAIGILDCFDGVDLGIEFRAWGWHFDSSPPGWDRFGGRAGFFVSMEKSWLALVFRGGVVDPVDAGPRGYVGGRLPDLARREHLRAGGRLVER